MDSDIKNIFTKNLITITESSMLSDAEALMSKNKIRHLPVVNDKNIVGILSKTDFRALKHIELNLSTLPVKKFMSSPVRTISKKTSIKELAQLFITQKINSALISDNNAIVGIVTSEDLIKVLAENIDLMTSTEKINLESIAPEGFLFT